MMDDDNDVDDNSDADVHLMMWMITMVMFKEAQLYF